MQPIVGKRLSHLLTSYYLGPDHPAKLRLWSWLRRLMRYSRFTIKYANDGWITLDERDYLQHEILTKGCYEPEVWGSLSTFALQDECVWDVGANIGSFAIIAMLDSRVRALHVFEPDPYHADILAYNLRSNRGSTLR